MNTYTVLLLAALTVCTIARPPGPTLLPDELDENGPLQERAPLPSPKELLNEYLLPRYLISAYSDLDSVADPMIPRRGQPKWWSKELARLIRMEDDEIDPYDVELSPTNNQDRYNLPYMSYLRSPKRLRHFGVEPPMIEYSPPTLETDEVKSNVYKKSDKDVEENQQRPFASTPLEKEFYAPIVEEDNDAAPPSEEFVEPNAQTMTPRMTRQNPNMSRQKTLVAENLDRLKAGLHEVGGTTDQPGLIHVKAATDPAKSIYSVAFMAAMGAAVTMSVVAFVFVGYKLSKRAKAAADVDYPAYGVTGPTADPSGDRKLAQSAHMYHYQHQKQQIIAMERICTGCEKQDPSVSDPDSEEENEEGDYTVYEWPGPAATGDMEVKNPLFNDDPTPATPGNCELVKQQPPKE